MRNEDESGVSGTGRVAEGVVFQDGTVALRWLTAWRSTAFYESMEHLEHIHGHHGKTKIVLHDDDNRKCDPYGNGNGSG